MKKTICAILVISMFMSMAMGCKNKPNVGSNGTNITEESTTVLNVQNKKEVNYREEYIEAVEKWIYFTGEANRFDYPNLVNYVFLDLNFDGYPELIRSVRNGSGGDVINEYYTFKPDSGIEKMDCTDSGCWDNNWASLEDSGYIIKSDNGYSYILKNESHAVGVNYIKIDYIDGSLKWEEVGTAPLGNSELLPDYPFEIFGERKTNSEEVEKVIADKCVECNISSYSVEDFLWSNKRARREILVDAYDSYFVDGHTFLGAGECEEPSYRKYVVDHKESTVIREEINNFDVEYTFPKIMVKGNYADECNSEIYNISSKAIAEAKGEYGPSCYIEYDCWLNGDVLSVVCNECTLSGNSHYYVYNINVVTGERVSDDEILERVGMTRNEYNAGLEGAHREGTRIGWSIVGDTSLEDYIVEYELKYSQDLLPDQLRMTLSPENMQQARVFIGYDNELWLVNHIYSNGGADYYEQLFRYPVK